MGTKIGPCVPSPGQVPWLRPALPARPRVPVLAALEAEEELAVTLERRGSGGAADALDLPWSFLGLGGVLWRLGARVGVGFKRSSNDSWFYFDPYPS